MIESTTPAAKRFRELVRQRRAVLPRKERSNSEIYFTCSLRHLLETVSNEMKVGIAHDPTEVAALIELANEHATKSPARPRRFRGLNRK